MRPVLTVAEMQAVDAEAARSVPLDTLVARAGGALASAALRMLGGAYGRRVVVLAGPGNNGEDGRVAARSLRRRGALVEIVDPAAANLARADLVVDAAFGTGFRGTYRPPRIPEGARVLACDIPSGVHGDTGEACGEPLRADRTLTFAAWKPGLLQGEGRALAGEVTVADIGLPAGDCRAHLIEDADVGLLPGRPHDAHKWQSAVMVVAGAPGMLGAATLVARAALRAGAGMVRLGAPGFAAERPLVTEAVGVPLGEAAWSHEVEAQLPRCRALVVGPGLGREVATVGEVRRLLAARTGPVVVDADGLWALGDAEEAAALLGPGAGRGPVVLTPHDGEAARLAGTRPGGDRLAAARVLAERTGAVVLLKGPTTVVADPGGRVLVATSGSPDLATAGTGDVLSGVIGAFLARGMTAIEAAALAAHAHGRAASLGLPGGLVAGDLPELLARWLAGDRSPAVPAGAGCARCAGGGDVGRGGCRRGGHA